MTCTAVFNVGNSNVVELQTLTNSVTEVADTAATVTVRVTDLDGTEVTGHIWPLNMPHDTGGTYRVVLDEDLGITVGQRYFVQITATGGSGETGYWECVVRAQTRRCE